ncbi:unnamed protein product [Cladocopium goreaui]|uniref:C3H1-type domain-containing protein n=1 Tax=Cladocopium goreaui TaxID=2562237 RepID=A0A9P1FVP3_9DINO|nr:unnamed protein product [Cladocopium goreaui]
MEPGGACAFGGDDTVKSSVTSMVDSVGQLLQRGSALNAPAPPSALLAPPAPPKPPPATEASGYWTRVRAVSPPPAPSIVRQARDAELLAPQSLSPWVLPEKAGNGGNAGALPEHEAQLLGSCPPGSQILETFEPEEEVTRRANVRGLEDRAKELTLKRDLPGSTCSDPLAGLLSRGSYGHPELCRRPCLFLVQKQECLKGASCDFCHLEHSKLPSLDGLQRRTLSSLSQSQLLPLLIAPLRAKV